MRSLTELPGNLGHQLEFPVTVGFETLGQMVHPFPHGIDSDDHEARDAAIANAPLEAFLPVLVAWTVGTFIGAFVAAWIAGKAPVLHGLIVGAFFFSAALAMMVMHTHPLWFMIAGLGSILPVAFVAGKCARPTAGPAKWPFSRN